MLHDQRAANLLHKRFKTLLDGGKKTVTIRSHFTLYLSKSVAPPLLGKKTKTPKFLRSESQLSAAHG